MSWLFYAVVRFVKVLKIEITKLMKEKFISIKKERILKRFKLVIQKQISYLPATYRQKVLINL